MAERANVPVLPPQPNPTISYWQDPPDAVLADYQSTTTLPQTADVVIIGSGITGSSVAYNLLNSATPPTSVVLLEARQACSGATGRNGGHTKAASYRTFPSNAERFGAETAAKIARFEYDTIKSLQAFAREHEIDCDLYSGETADVVYDEGEWEFSLKAVEAMRKAMPDDLDGASAYKVWTPEEAREKYFVKGQRTFGAVSYFAGSLSAYKFVMGVLRLALGKGLQFYTTTPVGSVTRDADGEGWVVKTAKGDVKAKKVVMATNGYTGAIWPAFQGKIVPLRGQITAHRPGKNMPKEGLGSTYSFTYSGGFEYMIPRPPGSKFAGDIIIGGGLTHAKNSGVGEFGLVDDSAVNKEVSDYLTATTERFFGESWGEDHDDGRIRREWSGIMGFSNDGLPYIGEMPGHEGLWVAASFQGHGMVLAWRCAEAIVKIMEGGEAEKESQEWFPEIFKVSEERLKGTFSGKIH